MLLIITAGYFSIIVNTAKLSSDAQYHKSLILFIFLIQKIFDSLSHNVIHTAESSKIENTAISFNFYHC